MNMHEIMKLYENAISSFILQPKLNPDFYKMTDTLASVKTWKAMTYDGNSDDDKKDHMDGVGYIMISKTDNTIVPISRGDEHHHGMDTLWKLGRKYKFDANQYVPIWAYGNNYIYDKSDIPVILVALTKYLSYGGLDGVLNGYNDLSGKIVTLSYFVQNKGNMSIAPKQLAPVGKEILESLQKFVTAKEAAQAADMKTSKRMIAAAFVAAMAFVHTLSKYAMLLPHKIFEILDDLPKTILRLKADGDIEGLDKLFFDFNGVKNILDFNGVKNILHNELRASQKRIKSGNPDPWYDRKTIGVWGDLDQAIDMLGYF